MENISFISKSFCTISSSSVKGSSLIVTAFFSNLADEAPGETGIGGGGMARWIDGGVGPWEDGLGGGETTRSSISDDGIWIDGVGVGGIGFGVCGLAGVFITLL